MIPGDKARDGTALRFNCYKMRTKEAGLLVKQTCCVEETSEPHAFHTNKIYTDADTTPLTMRWTANPLHLSTAGGPKSLDGFCRQTFSNANLATERKK
jgi:hypothetical protein